MLLFNFSDNDFEVKEGDRIAQLILERIVSPQVVVVQETTRGAGGFGSTGGFGAFEAAAVAAASAPAMNGTVP